MCDREPNLEVLSRRGFLQIVVKGAAIAGGAAALAGVPGLGAPARRLFGLGLGLDLDLGPGAAHASEGALAALIANAPVARYWTSTSVKGATCGTCHTDGRADGAFAHDQVFIKCLLCAQGCLIAEGKRGRCHTRMNVKGELRSLVYGRPISIHVDPIEKKPFYHFLPGREAFSLATSGCPLSCQFCQNWQISQALPEDYATPVMTAQAMAEDCVARGAPVIAFTYNESTVYAEYLIDIAKAAKAKGLRPVLISCGYMNEAPLADMCDVLDAIKIDLKGFSPEFYRKVSSAELAPVLRSIKQIAKRGRHLEIVNLVVPTLNDSDAMLNELCAWVAGEVGPDVPVHFTRFHPDYKLQNLAPTPVATLERARETAARWGLRYAYVGNVPGHLGNNTYCPSCKQAVIERSGLFLQALHLDAGRCAFCKHPIAGVWV